MKKNIKNRIGRRIVTLLLTVVMVMSVLGGCGTEHEMGKKSVKTSGKGTKVILNEVAHSIFYAPMYVAIEKGYFQEEGIDLILHTGFGADKTMTAVLTGEADIGFMGAESTVYTYVGGTEDYVVNFAQLTQRAGNFLVSREPIEQFRWAELKGKTVIGGRNGGMPEMVFEYILEKQGIDPKKDLKIDQSIDFGATAAAFSGGHGDFTVEFEPHATMLEQKGDGYVVASLGEESGYVPYTSFCAKESYINSHGEEIQAFTNALQKGIDYVNAHSAQEIAEVIKPQFKEMDDDTLSKIVERYHEQDTWKKDLIFDENSFDLLQNILEGAGVIEARVAYEKLVTTRFAEEAVK